MSKRSPITSSQQTLVEENLAAYCEPWGAALPPTPGNRHTLTFKKLNTKRLKNYKGKFGIFAEINTILRRNLHLGKLFPLFFLTLKKIKRERHVTFASNAWGQFWFKYE